MKTLQWLQQLTEETTAAQPKANAKVKANSKAKAKAKAKGARAARNTKGTFAGRRPPSNPQKLAVFLKMKELYHETKSKPIPGDRKRKGKGASETQGEYWGFMQQKMAELAKEGVQGGERMKLAAKAWKERPGNEGKSKASAKASAEVPKPTEGTKWILFHGTTEPVRLDMLTSDQELMLENGTPHVYVEAPEH